MRSLRYSISLVVLSIASSLALSDHANAVLDDLSALQKSLQSNQDTIERYNGGLAAATPLLTGFYKTWSSLRTANAHIPRDARFTSDDSDAIYESLNSSNDMSIDLFHAYEKKAPLFHKSGASFAVPLFMDALDREVDDYRVSLRDMMPERYAAPMDQMRITHTKAREATFAAYEPNDNSDANSAVMRFASTVTPVLGLLPL